MSRRDYLCPRCGFLRRASSPYSPERDPRTEAPIPVREPVHCRLPMQMLTYEQKTAAVQLTAARRAEWITLGGHILRRGGKRQWTAALNKRQVADALREVTLFREKLWAGVPKTPPVGKSAPNQRGGQYKTARTRT